MAPHRMDASGRDSTSAQEPEAVLDAQFLRELFDGDAEAIFEVLDLFRTHLPEQRGALAQSVASADVPATARAAHKLKGALRQIGANEAASCAASIEREAVRGGRIDEGSVEALDAALHRLDRAQRSLCETLRA